MYARHITPLKFALHCCWLLGKSRNVIINTGHSLAAIGLFRLQIWSGYMHCVWVHAQNFHEDFVFYFIRKILKQSNKQIMHGRGGKGITTHM